jgi:hypothetical protein
MRHTLRILSTLLSVCIVTLGISAAPAFAAPEGQFVSKINATRVANGMAPLEVYWDLSDDAEAHSNTMMEQDHLHHNPNLANVTSGWDALAENVGVGPDPSRLHEAFMESAGHRRNILGNYNYLGVGVVRQSDTKIWVTVVFMRGPEGLVSPPDEPPPAEPPADPAPVPEPEPDPSPQPDPSPVPDPEPSPAPKPPAPAPVKPARSLEAVSAPASVRVFAHPARSVLAI